MAEGSNYDWDGNSQRIVIESRQALERTSASLARSNQVAIEAEQVGTEVLSVLGEQRESLLNSKSRLDEMNVDLSKSSALLRLMRRNIIYNKLILVSIILLELCILSALIYLNIFKKKK